MNDDFISNTEDSNISHVLGPVFGAVLVALCLHFQSVTDVETFSGRILQIHNECSKIAVLMLQSAQFCSDRYRSAV